MVESKGIELPYDKIIVSSDYPNGEVLLSVILISRIIVMCTLRYKVVELLLISSFV